MKTSKLSLRALPVVGLGLLAAPLSAGDLRPELVPDTALWMAHVDLVGFQGTSLWGAIHEMEEIDLEEEVFADVRAELGIDPLRDLRSITVYGMGNDPENAVVLVEGTAAVDVALARLQEEDGARHRLLERDGLEIHSWGDGEGYVHVRGDGDERLVLVSPDLDLLVAGARLAGGDGASLASSPTPRILARPQPGSFAFLAASEGIPGIHEIEPASRIASLVQGVVVDLGEDRGELHLRVEGVARNPEDARNVSDVVSGAMALAQLAVAHGGEDVPPELRRLLGGVRVATSGNAVSFSFRYPVGQLLRDLSSLEEHEDR